jgi:glycine cleavage system H protein
MSEPLRFMMGKFEAEIPGDRLYAKNHMWAMKTGDAYRFGFSAYAVRLLQDVYFLDWEIAPGAEVRAKQEIGSIESSKAESSLYAPIPGRLSKINERLLTDPSTINVDKYGDGWLLEIHGDAAELLSPAAYLQHLESAWQVAQRTLKGQFNE